MASGNNIQALREARGWSRPDLGKRMNTSGQQVERLEKGQRKLTQEWMERAADALGVVPADLIGEAPEAAPTAPTRSAHTPTRSADAGETVDIVQLDLSLSMGPGTAIEDFVESEVVSFDAAVLRRITRTPSTRLRFVTGIGTSHEPKFQSGDQFLIDINERRLTRLDGYYWITFDGAHALKRLRPLGNGRIQIISENPDFAPMDVDADAVRIEGRAVWFARGL